MKVTIKNPYPPENDGFLAFLRLASAVTTASIVCVLLVGWFVSLETDMYLLRFGIAMAFICLCCWVRFEREGSDE